jgi:hypothetical protein
MVEFMEADVNIVNATDLWGLDGVESFYNLAEETPYSSMATDKVARLKNLADFLRGRPQFQLHYEAVAKYLSSAKQPGLQYVLFDV